MNFWWFWGVEFTKDCALFIMCVRFLWRPTPPGCLLESQIHKWKKRFLITYSSSPHLVFKYIFHFFLTYCLWKIFYFELQSGSALFLEQCFSLSFSFQIYMRSEQRNYSGQCTLKEILNYLLFQLRFRTDLFFLYS